MQQQWKSKFVPMSITRAYGEGDVEIH